jgi:hypothetical protein
MEKHTEICWDLTYEYYKNQLGFLSQSPSSMRLSFKLLLIDSSIDENLEIFIMADS